MNRDLIAARRQYAEQISRLAGMTFLPVVDALAAVPRESFLGPGPWEIVGEGITPDSDPRRVYRNVLVVLDKAKGLNNGEPGFWAAMFDRPKPSAGERVVHAGTGSGYYTALLAQMVGESGEVLGIEYEPLLAEAARANLAPWPQASIRHSDALALISEPADIIVASAGFDAVPLPWVRLLKPGGRLLIPLTMSWAAREKAVPWSSHEGIGVGGMLLVSRSGDGYAADFVSPVGIYHFKSARTAAATTRLEQAFDKEAMVRAGPTWRPPRLGSLRLNTDPDESCWLEGAGWWLSTEPPP